MARKKSKTGSEQFARNKIVGPANDDVEATELCEPFFENRQMASDQ